VDESLRSVVERLGSELVVVCSPDGRCRWLDARAERVLCGGEAAVGKPFDAMVDPASHAKARALFERVKHETVHDWELRLLAHGRPSPFTFAAETSGGQVVLVAVPARDGKADLETASRQLAESNEGLKSLHAELDEKNDTLRRSADVKTRLVANVSHEFRTPINSILGLSRLLLDRTDGDLTSEQETQIEFIRTNAETLRGLIDDVLDLSKIEAGKVSLRPTRFAARSVLAALRGTMRALPRCEGVELFVDEPPDDMPELHTDEPKVSQILRNLVSNALKFTKRGEVRVSVKAGPKDTVAFIVSDTGIGIAPEHQERVFEEFAQIDGESLLGVRGTGLGLSVSRRLANILGGELTVQSALGQGSTFTLTLPRVHLEESQMQALVERSRVLDPRRAPVLVVEDDRQTMFLYERYLSQSGFQVIPARTSDEARVALSRVKPAAIVLDVMLEAESTWRFLREVKEGRDTCDIPVMVVTVVDSSQKARALGADEFWLKPTDPDRVRRKLLELARRGPVSVLLVDDDETARYIFRRILEDTPYVLHEAATAGEAIRLARDKRPNVILLDFVLGESTAFDVIDELKAHPDTRNIPIIIQTGRTLGALERDRLARDATAILSKQSLSRELAMSRIREALQNAGVKPGEVGRVD
jgi:signal transduction histidine kinase/CheY-like chemotaxis protein